MKRIKGCFLVFVFIVLFHIHANASTTWNILWINIASIQFNGHECNMTENDYVQSKIMSQRFTDFITRATNGMMTPVVYEKTITNPITEMDPYMGYWIAPENITSYLNQFFQERKYDSIMVLARMDGIKTEYWGLGTQPQAKSNGAGYAFVRFLEGTDTDWYLVPTTDNPYPEEVYVHEWIHQIEGHYNAKGFSVPSADDALKYGYTDLTEGAGGWYRFYEDILSCNVLDPVTGKRIGVPGTAWADKPSHVHVWDTGTVTKQPTCSEEGFREYRCTICGATKTEKIPATGKPAADKATGGKTAADKVTEGKTTPKKTPADKAAAEKITIQKTPSSVKAKAKKNKVTVSWKKIKKNKAGKKLLKQIKSIQVQYSTDKTFKKNVKTKTVGKKKTKIKLKLQKKTTYYVRVRYKGSKGFSKWSKVKRIKTK